MILKRSNVVQGMNDLGILEVVTGMVFTIEKSKVMVAGSISAYFTLMYAAYLKNE